MSYYRSPMGTCIGPACTKCGLTLWLYTPGESNVDDGRETVWIQAKCASCHATDEFEVRNWDRDVTMIRERHVECATRRMLPT